MYFASFDNGETWISCRAITIPKVKAYMIHHPSVRPDVPLYIGQRDTKGTLIPVLKGEMRKARYVWSEIVVMNQPLRTVNQFTK